MRLILILTISFILVWHCKGQYNISSNQKCIAALKDKSLNGDQLLTTANRFFEYPQKGKHNEWLSLLSADCFEQGKPAEATNNWWNYLANNCINFEILGQAPEFKLNQKNIYFKIWSHDQYKGEKKLVLIEENGNWKIYSIDL
jgi:hypothetical protein